MYIHLDAAKVAEPTPHECPYTECDTKFVGTFGKAWIWADDENFYRAIFCCHSCFLAALPWQALPRT